MHFVETGDLSNSFLIGDYGIERGKIQFEGNLAVREPKNSVLHMYINFQRSAYDSISMPTYF